MEKLDIDQAAAHLGLSPEMVRRRLRSGEMQGEKVPVSGMSGGYRWLVAIDQEPEQDEATEKDSILRRDHNQGASLGGHLQTIAGEISELRKLLTARVLNDSGKSWWAFWRRYFPAKS